MNNRKLFNFFNRWERHSRSLYALGAGNFSATLALAKFSLWVLTIKKEGQIILVECIHMASEAEACFVGAKKFWRSLDQQTRQLVVDNFSKASGILFENPEAESFDLISFNEEIDEI